ncbi:MAG: hypothetical protein V7K92_19025 [Nostoc sp.]|uniref:hypothetical protein n=1 Tax=Nostoc sp. TaxID=1180 RepID=UPI002FF3CE53
MIKLPKIQEFCKPKKESGFVPMFGKLAIISGCDGAKHPQYAIAPQLIRRC